MMFCQTLYDGPYPVHIILLIAERSSGGRVRYFNNREIFIIFASIIFRTFSQIARIAKLSENN